MMLFDSRWGLAVLSCLAFVVPCSAQTADSVPVASPEQATAQPGESTEARPIDLAFMYKGISKFVKPEDQEKVKELLKSAETLGPDEERLILEEIDRRVPNGPGFNFDGIMWSNENNEFAAIDVYATSDQIPEDWAGLIVPPFEFPIGATYVVGRTQRWEWFGSAPTGIRVFPNGEKIKPVGPYASMYQILSDLVRGPETVIGNLASEANSTAELSEKENQEDRTKRHLTWKSSADDQTALLIGDWPFSLEENPQGDCLLIREWQTSHGSKMWVIHLYVWLIEPAAYELMEAPEDLFATYSFFKGIRHYGFFSGIGDSERYFRWVPEQNASTSH